jgi:hypothetical protein
MKKYEIEKELMSTISIRKASWQGRSIGAALFVLGRGGGKTREL